MFLFRCEACPEYEVKEDHFKQFITPDMLAKLERKYGPDKDAILHFRAKCPRCAPGKQSSHADLKLRKRKEVPAKTN